MASTHSVFVGSFNAAGGDSAGLTEADAAAWLRTSAGADIVVLGFQEFGAQPAAIFPPPKNNTTRTSYLRALAPEGADAAEEASTQAALDAALGCGGGASSERVRIADIAMGEPPACRAGPQLPPLPPGHDSRDSTPAAPAEQFYGYLRLQVYARRGLAEAHGLLPAQGASESGAVEAFVVPAGSKKTSVRTPGATAEDVVEGRAAADGFQYTDGSPDKGGVAVRLRFGAPDGTRGSGKSLLLVCCHLAGTNKYCMPEAFFERTRLQQLAKLFRVVGDGSSGGGDGGAAGAEAEEGAAASPAAAIESAIVFGDLNFRNEVFREGPRKEKGGDDWAAVSEMLAGEGGAAAGGGTHGAALAAAVGTFRQCDRLSKHLLKAVGGGAGAAAAAAAAAAVGEGCGVGAEGGEGGDGGGDGGIPEPSAADLAPLRGFSDTLAEQVQRTGASGASAHNLHPSFTYKLNEAHPRKFNTKRTPSWPDRVLVRGGSAASGVQLPPLDSLPDDAFEFGVKREVLCSDHEPVFARFTMKLSDS